ncbi:MAG: hypothetical protein FJ035_07995 [Chloroflexi bacterium]|nr:hypothetical protein [Chloroflexota bacterium]
MEEWARHDSIDRLRGRVRDSGGLAAEADERVREDVRQEIAAAVEAAERVGDPTPESALCHVW